MKKRFKIAIIVVAIAAVSVGAYLRLRPGEAAAASSVSTATVQSGSLTATVNAAGNIQAHQTADLSFGQSGTVQRISVKLSDRVKAGDVPAELDTTDLQLQS